MSLTLLPTEIQCSIIRLLDPIGLISISQASTHFRRAVGPKRKHFIERLLALELLPEHAGPSPAFEVRHAVHWTVELTEVNWDAMRWACTGCLRLRPREHFDHLSISRRRYRKPHPLFLGSEPAATSWEPAHHGRSRRDGWKRNDGEAAPDDHEQPQGRVICVTSCHLPGQPRGRLTHKRLGALWDTGAIVAEPWTRDQLARLSPAQRSDLLATTRCGANRRFRMCNECRYQCGRVLPWPYGTMGNRRLPIAPSRRLHFATHVDRWFPGLLRDRGRERPESPPFVAVVPPSGAYYHCYTTFMARCPGCARWQELRHLRIAGNRELWEPTRLALMWDGRKVTDASLDESRCNACFAATHGRRELGGVLLDWLNSLIRARLMCLSRRLTSGFRVINNIMSSALLAAKYGPDVRSLQADLPCLNRDYHDAPLDHSEVAALRAHRPRWKELWERMNLDSSVISVPRNVDECYDEWGRDFDEAEEQLRWLMACRTELEGKPEALAEWALNGSANERMGFGLGSGNFVN